MKHTLVGTTIVSFSILTKYVVEPKPSRLGDFEVHSGNPPSQIYVVEGRLSPSTWSSHTFLIPLDFDDQFMRRVKPVVMQFARKKAIEYNAKDDGSKIEERRPSIRFTGIKAGYDMLEFDSYVMNAGLIGQSTIITYDNKDPKLNSSWHWVDGRADGRYNICVNASIQVNTAQQIYGMLDKFPIVVKTTKPGLQILYV